MDEPARVDVDRRIGVVAVNGGAGRPAREYGAGASKRLANSAMGGVDESRRVLLGAVCRL
ncbi:hypothetical protein SB773_34985 [Bacillus sp. SIMBA_074]|uniref:hypothetical protein n=1 Tax=Bacillus sp. SIMBA_074 TaxID=3085812 RepID=UPI00397B25CD